MKLFMVKCNAIGRPLFFQASDSESAQMKFVNGLKRPEKYLGDPSFQIVEVTDVKQILQVSPEEFTLTNDASF